MIYEQNTPARHPLGTKSIATMKNTILTFCALGAFALTAQAQYVPSVEQTQRQYGVEKMSANPDFDQLPVVETGLPSFNLPGMSTVYDNDRQTAPLVEGFGTSYSSGNSSSYTVSSSTTNMSDRASDPQEGKWIDRDNDGYDPVVDEVEQGVETAVKATGQALEEVGEEVGEVFGNEDPDDVNDSDSDKERGILGKVVNGTGKAIKGTAKTGAKVVKGTAKTTGKVVKGTAKTTGKVAKGTVKTTGKVVRGTGKAAVNGTKAVGRTVSGKEKPNVDVDDNDMDGGR